MSSFFENFKFFILPFFDFKIDKLNPVY